MFDLFNRRLFRESFFWINAKFQFDHFKNYNHCLCNKLNCSDISTFHSGVARKKKKPELKSTWFFSFCIYLIQNLSVVNSRRILS